MRSTIRASGRVIFIAVIHNANAPASSVARTPTTAMLAMAAFDCRFRARLASSVLREQRVVECPYVVDQLAHIRVVCGGERGALAHHHEIERLNPDAVAIKPGDFALDCIGMLGVLGKR